MDSLKEDSGNNASSASKSDTSERARGFVVQKDLSPFLSDPNLSREQRIDRAVENFDRVMQKKRRMDLVL